MRLRLAFIALTRSSRRRLPTPRTCAAPRRSSPPSKTTGVPRTLPLKFDGPPTTGAITPLDLMTRLYKFADDSMMGRLAGTPWNDKGTDYIAAEVKRLGLTPAGDDGYFQHPLVSKAFADSSWIAVGGKRYALWKDFAPRYQGDTAAVIANAPAVFGGTWGDTASYLPNDQATGKVVVIRLAKQPDGSTNYQLVNRAQLTGRFSNAAAIAVEQLDYVPPGYVAQNYAAPSVGVKPDGDEPVRRGAVVLLRHQRASPTTCSAHPWRRRRPARPAAPSTATCIRPPASRRDGTSSPSCPAPIPRCAASSSSSARTTITSASTTRRRITIP